METLIRITYRKVFFPHEMNLVNLMHQMKLIILQIFAKIFAQNHLLSYDASNTGIQVRYILSDIYIHRKKIENKLEDYDLS